MNAEELIRSGLLEAYVLGQASPEEAALVERMRASDDPVREELDAIELALEQQAMQQAVAPAPKVRASIMDAIKHEGGKKEVPVIPIQREHKPFNWMAAASVAALVLSAVMNFMQYRELRDVRVELAQLQDDRSVLAEELKVQRTSMERTQQQLAVVMDPRAEMVVLNGMGAAEGHKARIYWDKTASAVHFDALSMPAPPEGTQYQLWALVDGQPVDAGMVSLEQDTTGLQRMKDVPNAQAFAVTVEHVGGSPTPTLTAMVLLGQI
ncbi:MAG: anti-sigma factor [Flavobacteriales bacterium]